jgi:transcriptional regulator with XRE-family HTH domain
MQMNTVIQPMAAPLGMRMGMEKETKNKAKEFRLKAGLSAAYVAKKAEVSKSHLSNVENNIRGLSNKLALKLSAIYNVPAYELAGVDLGVPVPPTVDQNLMASVVGLIHEAIDENKMPMPNPNDIGAWITLVYNAAISSRLNYGQTKELAKTIVKVSKKGVKPEPLLLGDMPKKKK